MNESSGSEEFGTFRMFTFTLYLVIRFDPAGFWKLRAIFNRGNPKGKFS